MQCLRCRRNDRHGKGVVPNGHEVMLAIMGSEHAECVEEPKICLYRSWVA